VNSHKLHPEISISKIILPCLFVCLVSVWGNAASPESEEEPGINVGYGPKGWKLRYFDFRENPEQQAEEFRFRLQGDVSF
jgi:hypothetical protein